MESRGNKRLCRKQFTLILQLPSEGLFKVPTFEKALQLFNEMGYQPLISLVRSFRKSNLPDVWNFFVGVTLRSLNGRSYGIYKENL